MDTWCNDLNQIAIVLVYFHTFICHFENKYLTHKIKKKKILLLKKLKFIAQLKNAQLEELIKN